MLGVEVHTEASNYQAEDSEGSDRENSTKGKRANKKMKTSA